MLFGKILFNVHEKAMREKRFSLGHRIIIKKYPRSAAGVKILLHFWGANENDVMRDVIKRPVEI